MDPGAWLGLGLLYLVFNALRKGGATPRTTTKPRSTAKPPPRTAPRPAGGSDPTQREGARLQELLRDLGRTLDQAAGPQGRPADHRLPPAAEVEDRRTLEASAEVEEREARRRERPMVDQDDEAEAVVARRLREAAQHGAPLTGADHLAFDSRIRQQPADHTATRPYSAAQLRNAMVWREILGPPVALREDLP